MDNVKITFFMIVTDPDIVIADYAVRSYAKIKGAKFTLCVYSNWVSSSLKRRYFPRWRKFSFVEIVEPECYSNEVICLNERWHTWFCIYKRAALRYEVSHAVHVEELSGKVRYKSWDTSGYLQKALKEDYGFELDVLDPKYQSCFIHYGAFSKNRDIHERNIGFYRRLQILRKRGLIGRDNYLVGKVNHWARKSASFLDRICFNHVDRSKYWPGWGQG